MKDKRIWIVIACILVIGSGLTKYTHSFVSSRNEESTESLSAAAGASKDSSVLADNSPAAFEEEQAGAAAETSQSQEMGVRSRMAPGPGAVSGQTADGGEEAGAAPGQVNDAGQESAALGADAEAPLDAATAASLEAAPAAASLEMDGGGQAVSQGTAEEISSGQSAAAEASVQEETEGAGEPISPLVGARPAEKSAGAGTDYRQRLEELDAQIARIQNEEQESNVYSIMTSAESELKMWESELNTIYSALLAALSDEEAAGLAQEQQEWMQNREARAAEKSGKGGSMESLGYAAALVSLTRDRAYELVDRYEETVS